MREGVDRLELNANESKWEGTDRAGYGVEVAMDNGSRTAHEDPRPARTPSNRQYLPETFQGSTKYFVVPVTYVTAFL